MFFYAIPIYVVISMLSQKRLKSRLAGITAGIPLNLSARLLHRLCRTVSISRV